MWIELWPSGVVSPAPPTTIITGWLDLLSGQRITADQTLFLKASLSSPREGCRMSTSIGDVIELIKELKDDDYYSEAFRKFISQDKWSLDRFRE